MTKLYVPMRIATCRELQVASNRAITYGRVSDALHLGLIEGVQKARDRGRLMAEVTSLEAYIRANVAGARIEGTLDALREKLERSGGPRTVEGPDWGTAEWDGHHAEFAHALPGPTAAAPQAEAEDAAGPDPAPQQEVLFPDEGTVPDEVREEEDDETLDDPKSDPADDDFPEFADPEEDVAESFDLEEIAFMRSAVFGKRNQAFFNKLEAEGRKIQRICDKLDAILRARSYAA